MGEGYPCRNNRTFHAKVRDPVSNADNLGVPNIKRTPSSSMARKRLRKIEGEKLEMEHEEAREQMHQSELEMGYEQDEKFEESKD